MLDLLTAAPRDVRFGGRTYRIGALKLGELGRLERWIRDNAESPMARYLREKPTIPEDEQRNEHKKAFYGERDWPPAIGTSASIEALMKTPDGRLFFVDVMFRKYQPAITPEELEDLAAGMGLPEMVVLVRVAFGDDDLDPKAVSAEVLEAKRLMDRLASEQTAETLATIATALEPGSPGGPPTGSIGDGSPTGSSAIPRTGAST